MVISKDVLIENLLKMEKPITFEALEKFNKLSNKTCTSKDIIQKVQEMMFTGEFSELYSRRETDEVVNDLDSLGLVKWPKNYVVYNSKKGDITIAEDTTRLTELLDKGYYTYCQYTEFGFHQRENENYYDYFVECAQAHIPHLYFESKALAEKMQKPIGDVMVEILEERFPS